MYISDCYSLDLNNCLPANLGLLVSLMLIRCFVAMTSLKYFLSKSVNHLREVTQYIVQRKLLYKTLILIAFLCLY